MQSRGSLTEGRHLGSSKHRTRHGGRCGSDLGSPHRALFCEKSPDAHVAREATGVSELVAKSEVERPWMGCRGTGIKTPPRARRSTKRFGRRENARFLGPKGRNPFGARRAQVLTMNPG